MAAKSANTAQLCQNARNPHRSGLFRASSYLLSPRALLHVRILAHKRYIPAESKALVARCRAVAAPLTGAEYAEVLSAALQTNYTVEELASAGLMALVHSILQGEIRLAAPKRKTVE